MESAAVLKHFEADIDVKRTVAIRPFTVVEGDTGNVLTLSVYDGNDAVDLTGCSAAVLFSHSRGISEQDSSGGGVTIDGNELEIALLPSSFAPGMVECEVQIYSGASASERGSLITTAKFNFVCRRAILNVDSIQTTPQFPILTGLIEAVETAETARSAAESARAGAETERQTAETARAAAEALRASAETARAGAETARSNAENLRAYEEIQRASAETARVCAETARASAESARASAESARASAETARVSAETARETASGQAVSAAEAAAARALAAAALITGGDVPAKTPAEIQALVSLGLHSAIAVGTEYEVYRMTDVTATYSGSGITGASVDAEDFIEKLSSRPAVYQFVKYGGKWYLYNTEGEEVDLAEYGVTVSGSPANGSSITVTVYAQRLVLDVADHDKCCSSDENSVVFLSKDIVSYWAIPLSEPQLLIHAKTALAPGKYRFTLDHGAYGGATGQDGTYIFSVGTEIPAGGGIRHSTVGVRQSSYSKAQITGGTVTTYGTQPARSVIESGVTVYEWNGVESCTDLGTVTSEDPSYLSPVSGLTDVNFTTRCSYGSNRYANSSLRKWLNSDGKPVSGPDTTFSYWWTPSDCFDMPPAESARKLAGFLYGLDPELAANLGEASVVTRVPVPDQAAVGKAKETLSDKVFLVSMAELYPMGTSSDYSVAEGGLLALFDGDTGNELKIKYYNGTARDWFTRSAYKNDGYYLWYAESDDGAGHITLASAKQGVVPAMMIKAPKEEEA